MEDGRGISREHLEIFVAETEEQIVIWEEELLALERDPSDSNHLDALFRAIHTIKGSAGFVGRDELKVLTHEIETVIQHTRDVKQPLDSEMLALLFEGLDTAKLCIEGMKGDGEPDIDYESVIGRIREFNSQSQTEQSTVPDQDQPASAEHEDAPTEPAVMVNGKTYSLEIEIVADESEAYLRGLLIQSKLEDVGQILLIDPPLEDLHAQGDSFRFTATVITDLTPDDLRKTVDIDQASVLDLKEQTPGGEFQQEDSSEPDIGLQLTGQPRKIDEVVRVHVKKLQSMMNLVGELVVANSRFVTILSNGRDEFGDIPLICDLEEKTESLAKIARDLQESVMKVSMLPVATIFSRFHRVVRDLAKHNGKEVNLEIFGEKTELDKRIMDGISEPLIHILRNAVDHGIEKREDRVAFGKSETGTIRLGAYQKGDQICVSISDDGFGIDKQVVIQKAMAIGVLDRKTAQGLTDKEVFDFLFYPGFSTSAEVTDVSGRGMGMDIVKKTVEDMGGSIQVESTLGLGTTTTITLPLTTAIINTLVVEAVDGIYAFPMSSVMEMIHPKRSELRRNQMGTCISLRDEVIVVLDLAEVLWPGREKAKNSESLDDRITIIFLDYDGRKFGMIVDKLIGKQETVVKSLSKNYRDVEGLIGATIMGSGRVALIIDVKSLLDAYYRDHASDNMEEPHFVDPDIETDQLPDETPEYAELEPEIPVVAVETEQDERLFMLNDLELEKMQEIMLEGAVNSSKSMTTLLGHEVRISFPDLSMVPLERIAETLGGDEALVAGIFVEFKGDISGGWVIIIPFDRMKSISRFLLGDDGAKTKHLSETEVSALKEMGNILTSSFIRSIADITGLDVHLEVPELSIDMCLAVIDSIVVRFNRPGKFVLVTEAELFSMDSQAGICQLFVLMEHESTSRLMHILTKENHGLYEKASELRRQFLSDPESIGVGGSISE